jgi:Protein of unknown function (DUF1566)
MSIRTFTTIVVSLAIAPGCSEPRCRPGEVRVGTICYEQKNSERDAASSVASDAVDDAMVTAAERGDTGGKEPGRDAAASGFDAQLDDGDVPSTAINDGSFVQDDSSSHFGPGALAPDEDAAAAAPPPPAQLVDECLDQAVCPPGYPCVDMANGYTCLGQWADWRMPHPDGRYTPNYSNTDSQVLDHVTGLSWQRALPETYVGCDRGPTAGSLCTLSQGAAYCDSLSLEGLDDWRLPSAIEMASITLSYVPFPPTEIETSEKYVDPRFFSTRTDGNVFLTSSLVDIATSQGPKRYAFGMMVRAQSYSPAGNTPRFALDLEGLVRCVRGVVPTAGTPATRYTIVDANTFNDTRTKLTWLAVSPSALDWYSSSAECTKMRAALPTKREARTLLDLTRPEVPTLSPLLPAEIRDRLKTLWTSFGALGRIADGGLVPQYECVSLDQWGDRSGMAVARDAYCAKDTVWCVRQLQ